MKWRRARVPREPALPLDRSGFAWCAAAAGAALLPIGLLLPAWLGAVLLVLVLLATGLGLKRIKVPALLRLLVTLLVAGLVLYFHGFRFGRDTGAALLAAMLALKLLETRHLRDARSLLSFGLFAIMAAFLQDQGPLTLLLALAATAIGLAALMRINELETPQAILSTSATARLRQTGSLIALSLPLAAVGFLLFPRLGSPLWGVPENVNEPRTGLSEDMSPGDISELYIDDSPVLRVRFEGAAPSQQQMYWRGPVLSFFDGRTWTMGGGLRGFEAAPLLARGEPLRYEVTQEPTDRRWIMALDVPTGVPAEAPRGTSLSMERMLLSRRPVTQMSRFQLESATDYILQPELRPGFRDWFTRVPRDFNPRTRALVEQWRADADDDMEVVQRALDWFNAEFTYTLAPQLLGRDSVDEFLFDTQEGYCEHFASAFTVMMRNAGIPARVVTGYQGGYYNPIGEYWLVRQSDAHAWSEIWQAGRGWVRIDPTSAVAPERIEAGADGAGGEGSGLGRWWRPYSDAADWLRRSWNDLVLGFNAATQRRLLSPFGIDEANWPQLGMALAIGIGACLALLLLVMLRGPARRRQDPLLAAWDRYLQRLARAGLRKRLAETAGVFAARAGRLRPDLAESLARLSDDYVEQRYARGHTDEAARAALIAALRAQRIRKRPTARTATGAPQ